MLSLTVVSHEKKYMVFAMPHTNEFLPDQTCLVKTTGYWSHFLYVNSVSFLNNLCKMEFGKYPKQSWVHVWPITHIQVFFARVSQKQGLSPFGETNFQDFSTHMNLFTSKMSQLDLLTVCQTFHIFHLSLTDFQYFPGPVTFSWTLQSWKMPLAIKFQKFSGFPRSGKKNDQVCWRSQVIPAMKSTGP